MRAIDVSPAEVPRQADRDDDGGDRAAACRVRFPGTSCVEQLKHATIPMLFIHGGADDFVPSRALDENFDACASIDRQKLLIPSAGHSMSASTAPVVYWKTVTNFVTRVFGL